MLVGKKHPIQTRYFVIVINYLVSILGLWKRFLSVHTRLRN